MASKKQRRRRAKERRHEYEYVYVDEEGHEVEAPPEATEPARNGRKAAAAPAKGKPKPAARGQGKGPARAVPAPSWQRVLKRAAIFAPFMFLTITLLGRHLTVASRILQTAYLLILFVPFSYLVDRAMYRRYLRQSGKLPQAKKTR